MAAACSRLMGKGLSHLIQDGTLSTRAKYTLLAVGLIASVGAIVAGSLALNGVYTLSSRAAAHLKLAIHLIVYGAGFSVITIVAGAIIAYQQTYQPVGIPIRISAYSPNKGVDPHQAMLKVPLGKLS